VDDHADGIFYPALLLPLFGLNAHAEALLCMLIDAGTRPRPL
jgi:hypothetical protein